MRVIDLTHTIKADMPVYPGTGTPKLEPARDGFTNSGYCNPACCTAASISSASAANSEAAS